MEAPEIRLRGFVLAQAALALETVVLLQIKGPVVERGQETRVADGKFLARLNGSSGSQDQLEPRKQFNQSGLARVVEEVHFRVQAHQIRTFVDG